MLLGGGLGEGSIMAYSKMMMQMTCLRGSHSCTAVWLTQWLQLPLEPVTQPALT
jgi:hypothetical protein